ncbi:mitochondrial adenine nucleotide transporter ADNT1-like protein [Tanacetum coccineum]
MASEDVVGKTSATIANIAEEAKIAASENVKAPSRQTLLGISKSLVAGGVAGGVSRTAVAPLERLKILLQVLLYLVVKVRVDSGLNNTPSRKGKKEQEVVRAQGFSLHMIELHKLKSSHQRKKTSTCGSSALFLVSKCCAIRELTLLDLCDERALLAQTMHSVQNPHAIKYNGTIQGLKYIWRTEGFRGMFKGNGTNCARIVPNSAVKFFSYEEASKGILWLYRQQPGNEDAELTPLLRLGAGACAGIIAMSATYPMDLVRGRITVQTEKSGSQYRGIAHALRTVLREEGPRALYKGWLPSVIGVVPYVGLNFAVYESLKDWLIKSRPFGLIEDTELSVITKLACGAAAGTVGQTVAYPLDVIRRRMQMVGWKDAGSVVKGEGKSAMEYTGMVDAFRKTVRHEGVGALYKGLVPNSVKVVPSIAIAFVSYEVIKDVLKVDMRISD